MESVNSRMNSIWWMRPLLKLARNMNVCLFENKKELHMELAWNIEANSSMD
jgi:hypothetical protein